MGAINGENISDEVVSRWSPDRTCGKALDGMLGELRKLTAEQEGVGGNVARSGSRHCSQSQQTEREGEWDTLWRMEWDRCKHKADTTAHILTRGTADVSSLHTFMATFPSFSTTTGPLSFLNISELVSSWPLGLIREREPTTKLGRIGRDRSL